MALTTLAVAAVVGLAVLGPAVARQRGAGPDATSSFVSLYPISDASEIDRYSLASGNDLGVLVRVPALPSLAEDSRVSTPHLLADGAYLITLDHSADCRRSGGGCRPIPNTCASRIETLDPATGNGRLMFTEPGVWRVFDAVPSPGGRSVALVEQACGGNAARLVVRDLKTGRQLVAVRHLSLCGLGSSATWTADGARLVFAYTRRHPNDPTSDCALAIAPAAQTTPRAPRILIHPNGSCSFGSAALDATGLVATESCATSDGGGKSELVQYGRSHRILRRLSLQSFTPPQYDQTAEVAADPRAHTVLVSQIVAAQPNVSWVWTFDGTKLHLVNSYFGASIIAEP